MSTTNTTTTTPDRKAQAAEAKARSAAAPAAVRAAAKSSTAARRARATAEEELPSDTRTPAERTAAEVDFYSKRVAGNEARVSKAEAAFQEVQNRILLDGDESAERDLVPARDEVGLARLQLEGSRNALEKAKAEHRITTEGDVSEQVTALVEEMTDPEVHRDLREAVAALLVEEAAKAEARNALIRAAVNSAEDAGLPSATVKVDALRTKYEAVPPKVQPSDGGVRTTPPVVVITGSAGRNRHGEPSFLRHGRETGLLAGGEYVHPERPGRAAALAICRAVGVNVEMLENGQRERSNHLTAFADEFTINRLLDDAWSATI